MSSGDSPDQRTTPMTFTIDNPPTVEHLLRFATVGVDVAAAFIGVSKGHYYAGVKAGTLPGLSLGRCVRVPVQPLLQLVGIEPSAQTAAA
ncbi:MAG: hypothetical protein ACOH14_07640 [Rhodoglobus sp.]